MMSFDERMTISLPDDWHHHLKTTVPFAAARFGRCIAMPNLKPPVTTTDQALAYKERILAAIPPGQSLEPLMTLYLTDTTTEGEIQKAVEAGIAGVKLYPAGATTNSDSGVTALEKPAKALRKMEELGLPLLIHGEVVGSDIDIFDREAVFIATRLEYLIQTYPRLRIVLEHCTTKEAVDFVKRAGPNVAATITAHHLLYNRNALFAQGGIRPHFFCMPILKAEMHRQALIEAATSGNPKFFLGTDSAPHSIENKECACGCAGVFTAHAAIELYAEAFQSVDQLKQLEAFASFHGADFYGLPRNQDTITLLKKPCRIPHLYEYAGTTLIPLRAGEQVAFTLRDRWSSTSS